MKCICAMSDLNLQKASPQQKAFRRGKTYENLCRKVVPVLQYASVVGFLMVQEYVARFLWWDFHCIIKHIGMDGVQISYWNVVMERDVDMPLCHMTQGTHTHTHYLDGKGQMGDLSMQVRFGCRL
jgi:hypothetical protein